MSAISRILNAVLLSAAIAPLTSADASDARSSLIVHEWGTFTSLQGEQGNALAGINNDAEPVPSFVHNIANNLLPGDPPVLPEHLVRSKGGRRAHPQITMRLETPVIYFHPPAGMTDPFTVDVGVKLHGGWLTEFYPRADADTRIATTITRATPAGPHQILRLGELSPNELGSLSWKGLEVGGDSSGPATDERVWTAPRDVEAAPVKSQGGEAEKFLFYRGVASVDAPIRVVADHAIDILTVQSALPAALADQAPLLVPASWLVHVRGDGRVAYQWLPPFVLTGEREIAATTAASFSEREFAVENLTALKRDMHEALVTDGLFADEAWALLNTWEVSYFKSPGLRLFFLLPQAWTDHQMPLELSVPAEVDRVMVGRIELVTPRQRELLAQIASAPIDDPARFREAVQARVRQSRETYQLCWDVVSGAAPLRDLGIPLPQAYQAYAELGRFRNALVLDELAKRPTDSLQRFVTINRLMFKTLRTTTGAQGG